MTEGLIRCTTCHVCLPLETHGLALSKTWESGGWSERLMFLWDNLFDGKVCEEVVSCQQVSLWRFKNIQCIYK